MAHPIQPQYSHPIVHRAATAETLECLDMVYSLLLFVFGFSSSRDWLSVLGLTHRTVSFCRVSTPLFRPLSHNLRRQDEARVLTLSSSGSMAATARSAHVRARNVRTTPHISFTCANLPLSCLLRVIGESAKQWRADAAETVPRVTSGTNHRMN